ncbi:hypothetical protein [Thioalkalivibrio sulfidiphilus]|uniref:hypothetical protein n=1 Tax=Thioalkalivibrio sulfidiphilus TaxID=1033854 RepID=UPI0012DC83E0|nr:hypothetical protein [Thioalkalivibrio sulfidiphilus]
MSTGPLKDKIRSRINFDGDEGDIAYYYALLLEIEYLTKVLVSGVISCLGDDADRSRYSLEYELVRADSIGDWVGILQSALTGPSAQFFRPQTTHISRELTERVPEGDWRFTVVQIIAGAAERLGINAKIGNRVALRQFFEFAAAVRNRTRGHGAITTEKCNELCPSLNTAIIMLWDNCELFKHDWAHLHRNLTGKYRVSPLLGECTKFDHLRSTKDIVLENGVYVSIDGLHHVPLLAYNLGQRGIFSNISDICSLTLFLPVSSLARLMRFPTCSAQSTFRLFSICPLAAAGNEI